MINIIHLYGSWDGRIGRLVHVCATLALSVLAIILELVLAAAGAGPSAHAIVALIMIYPGWMLAVKRAHDLDRSGWWVLGWSVAFAVGIPLSFILIGLVLVLPAAWFLVIQLFFFAGTSGSNQFGPPPASLLNDKEPLVPAERGVSAPVATTAPQAFRSAAPAAVPPAPRGLRQAVGAPRAQFGRRGVA